MSTLYDDRSGAGAGQKFKDAELLGCPLRLTVGKRGLADGIAESQVRGDGREEGIPLEQASGRAAAILAELE